jgi:hypothetical protein
MSQNALVLNGLSSLDHRPSDLAHLGVADSLCGVLDEATQALVEVRHGWLILSVPEWILSPIHLPTKSF